MKTLSRQRSQALVELTVGLVGLFGLIWIIAPLDQPVLEIAGGIGLLLYFLQADLLRSPNWRSMGLSPARWSDSVGMLALFSVLAIPLLTVIWIQAFPIDSEFYLRPSFWKRALEYPLWAFFQQYLFLVFFFRRFQLLFAPHLWIAVLSSALVFSLIHLPTPPLLIVCFVAGCVWALVFSKRPNLYAIAISHAILALYSTRALLMYAKVGPRADPGQWTRPMPDVGVRPATPGDSGLPAQRKPQHKP